MKNTQRHTEHDGRRLIGVFAAVMTVCVLFFCIYPPTASATSQRTSSAASSTTATTRNAGSSSDPDANVSEVTVSSNPQEPLGTIGFSESNTKRITVGKSTVLYLTIKDMGYNYQTTFETSDATIASVKKIDNRAVKVVGLKSGTVTITATIPKSISKTKTVTISAVGHYQECDLLSFRGKLSGSRPASDLYIVRVRTDKQIS